jgi:hypothetical protein
MPQPAPALVLRRVPPERLHLTRALAPEAPDDAGCVWWELVDVAAPPERAAAGVALTSTDAVGLARVLALAAVGTPDADPVPRLLLELVAALRRSDAVAVEVRCARPDLLATLRDEDVEHVGDVVVVRF